MNIVLINPPHTAIGSRIPREHLPPLGLLCVGGPLLDAGYPVTLIDAELAPMELPEIVQKRPGPSGGRGHDRPFRVQLGSRHGGRAVP